MSKEVKVLYDGGPVLLSSLIEHSREDLTVFIGGNDLAVYNDGCDAICFIIDDEYMRESVIYTIDSMRVSGRVSDMMKEWMQKIYVGNTINGVLHNYLEITDSVVLGSVYKGKIVKQEVFRVFGVLLGVYTAIRCGYYRIYIDNIDAYMHPSRQRSILSVAMEFGNMLRDKMKGQHYDR